MNNTTLNLLAVSVFALTLLSLVGPLLNISPGAIAVVITGCAGAIALDRLSWQGKGANLLLDIVSSQSSGYRQRIIHHEAGHFLVAHLLEIPVESYTLSAWEGLKAGLPGLGGVIVASNPTAAELLSEQQVNRYCTLWMAGIAAEMQTFGTAHGGDDDKRQLQRLWQQARLVGVPTARAQAVDSQLRWALLQAQTLIEQHQKAYCALVEAMTNRHSVDICIQHIEANRSDSAPNP
ncbi:MAG: ATP-dependent Zn protease [Phormidesmis sp. RL_2_1]|nr:ATP-dependent Zn protease [Phormidesmis sp. RL_2_1]